ncbi:MAG TPA: BlaI/MecI/CopY family transcriptional regulator [Acidimicrobiales bacterium]|nr:BlaI/MecI/CopY family transcriptional regulator [Acidimicrobiales bacterium]
MVERRARGALEADVLAVLWASGDQPMSAGQVRDRLAGNLAYTTVNTILTRLHEKGALDRRASGRGFVYTAVLDQAGLAASRMRRLLTGEPDRLDVLSQFVDGLDDQTLTSLRVLLERDRQP